MPDESVPFVRRPAALIITLVVGLVVGALALHGVATVLANTKRARVVASWAGTLETFEEIVERHPTRDANETALRVEGWGASLGIDIAPRFVEERVRPSDAARGDFREVRLALGQYIDRQFARSGPVRGEPSDRLVAYFDEKEEVLAELRGQLANRQAPRWQLQVEKPVGAHVPNLRGHVDLQNVLLADSMLRADRGDSPGALAALEASWKLNEALRDDPILITQLVALNVARMQTGAMRHIERLPRAWVPRLYEHDYRRTILTALQYEGWLWMAIDEPAAYAVADAPWTKLMLSVGRPYIRFCAADLSDQWRRNLIALTEVEIYCDRDPERDGFSLDLEIPGWNLMNLVVDPNLDGVIRRIGRYELDRELTAKLIELRAARETEGGRWPSRLPGIERSDVCPEDRWVYAATPDGEMSLAFSRPIDWAGLQGKKIPALYGTAVASR